MNVHTLSNGVRVCCDPVPGLETLALSVVAGRGARWEDTARGGWSHLLEHMVFKGAATPDGDVRSARAVVEVVEAAGGQINAATGYERTSFQIRALAGGLPLAAAVLSDLVLRPVLDPADLVKEVSVIAQEIAEAADAPDDLVFDLAQAAAYGAHPLGRPILGAEAAIAAADPAALHAWRSLLYAPDRLVVSASGAVDEDEVLALAERWFGPDAASASGPPAPPPTTPDFQGGVSARSRRLEQAHMVLLLPGVGAGDDDYFAMRLFAEALGGGMSSRLFQEAREVRGLAYAVDAYADTYADGGLLGVYAGTAAHDAEAATVVCAQQIAALAEAPREDELSRAKAQLKGSLFMARESPLARAEQAAGQVLLFGRRFASSEIAEGIDAVGLDDLRRVGRRVLASGRCAAAVLGPKAALGAGAAFSRALFG